MAAPFRINLLITTYYLDRGGLEEVILTYAKYLPKDRFAITVAFLKGGTVSDEIAKIEGVNVVHIDTPSRFQRLVRFVSIARKTKAQVVHNHACWYGMVAGFFAGARNVETVHNMYHWFTPGEKIRYALYCMLADRIITVSDYVRRFTLDFFPLMNSSKFEVIHNGIICGRFENAGDVSGFRSRHGISQEDVVVGFVGRLTDQKGVEYLLDAAAGLAKDHPRVFFLIVGDGELRESLEQQARKLGLGRIVFAGFQRDIPAYLQMFDIFVLPSLWEGLPMSVLEAMAAGKPVIATRVSGTPEVVEDGTTGFLVEPRDAGQLQARLGELIANGHLRKQMGEAGRNRVRKEFSAEKMVASTEAVYRRILGQA